MEYIIINKKNILCIIFITLLMILTGCSSSKTNNDSCTLSYTEFLNMAEENHYSTSEYELTLENYPVKQIDITKADNFSATYQTFDNSEGVNEIFNNTKKYYKSLYKIKNQTDDKIIFEQDGAQITLMKSNFSILSIEDKTNNYIATANFLKAL